MRLLKSQLLLVLFEEVVLLIGVDEVSLGLEIVLLLSSDVVVLVEPLECFLPHISELLPVWIEAVLFDIHCEFKRRDLFGEQTLGILEGEGKFPMTQCVFDETSVVLVVEERKYVSLVLFENEFVEGNGDFVHGELFFGVLLLKMRRAFELQEKALNLGKTSFETAASPVQFKHL